MEAARTATTADVARIVELARELTRELRPMKGGELWARREARREPLAEAYTRLVTSADAHIVVGTIQDVIIGFGVVQLERLQDTAILGVISELFVEADARAVGVGEAIIGELVEFCSRHGCAGIDALALPGHRAAKNFFEDSGFTARALVMHRRCSELP